jgi:hypothetical protein
VNEIQNEGAGTMIVKIGLLIKSIKQQNYLVEIKMNDYKKQKHFIILNSRYFNLQREKKHF